jgi:DNA-binding transcriptional ArsR family regulator
MTANEREIGPNIANLAALIGEPARAAMLWCLMGGQARPAGELARIAGVSPQAASAHLARLTEGGLLDVRSKGRHRFFSLSGPEAAAALESLAAFATINETDVRVVSLVPLSLRKARRCWGHLAGELGVRLHDILITRGWISATGESYEMSDRGREAVEGIGIDLAALRPSRRGIVYPCLDWSERRSHLGGPLASALLDLFIARGWMVNGRARRELQLTPAGLKMFDSISFQSISGNAAS